MTKKYRYNQARPFSAARIDGQIIEVIHDGETVTTSDNVSYVTKNGVTVSVSEEALHKYFTRIYSFEEQQRYAHLWEKAMFAAMQGIITGIASNGRAITPNGIPVIHHEVADLSLVYADLMVAKLKEREF
jgi:hypothetical protein